MIDNVPMLLATIKHEGNQAIIPFPTNHLSDILDSVGIMVSLEKVHLERTEEARTLAQLFQENHSLTNYQKQSSHPISVSSIG